MALKFYSGKSRFNGQPIVAYATLGSANVKTGDGVQIWILPEGVHPSQAQKTGQDAAVCGNCEHRPIHAASHGVSDCYVTTWQAPAAVYRSSPMECAPADVNKAAKRYGYMRLGAYGDPVHIPLSVIRQLVDGLDWTGYTRQWDKAYARGYSEFLMASVKNEGQYRQAKSLGWRTFRTAPKNKFHDGLFKFDQSEVLCPASAEAGAKIQCNKCLSCNGTASNRIGDIYIPAH